MTSLLTYRIEAHDDRQGWVPAPGDATGWTLDGARAAIAGEMYWLDGSIISDVRIVCEQDGRVVDD